MSEMTLWLRLRLMWFEFQWSVRDITAAILQDLAEWIAP